MMGQPFSDSEKQFLADWISVASTVSLDPGVPVFFDISGSRSRAVVGLAPTVFYVQSGPTTGTALGGRLVTSPIEN